MLRSAAALWRVAGRQNSVSENVVNQVRIRFLLSGTLTSPHFDLGTCTRCQIFYRVHGAVRTPLACDSQMQ